ncbi:uncharacterized protein LOC128092984 [Culex pipiens pallens]|uniref:uncharacterized protein LOC128092984 n=1 Tax=Culex pipiens pallens TaxID=42434 RepID=UPI0022AB1FC1|nr:uncharacterized protein LOC128092984 [Culex pipiens pallens]
MFHFNFTRVIKRSTRILTKSTAMIRVISDERLLSKQLADPLEYEQSLRRPPHFEPVTIGGITFPIADEATVEKLEAVVRSDWSARQAYVELLRSQMPRRTDAHRIYDIVSNRIFSYKALQNYYLTADRQPYFKQENRKAMVNYEIFQGCMLEAWADMGVDSAGLKNALRAVVMVISRKLRKSIGTNRRF